MNKTRITKLGMILVVCVLLVGAALGIGITASADDSVSSAATVGSKNVVYNEKTHLAVEVVDASAPEGYTLGLIAWDTVVSEYTPENASYQTYGKQYDSEAGKYYYVGMGIPANEYYEQKTYALCLKSDETGAVTVLEATAFNYSVAEYAMTNINSAGFDEEQTDLYSKLLKYGKYAYLVLENADMAYVVVETVGGTVGELGVATIGGGAANEEIRISAPETNAAGESFSYWAVSDGTTVAERDAAVSQAAVGTYTYTAVYGAAN